MRVQMMVSRPYIWYKNGIRGASRGANDGVKSVQHGNRVQMVMRRVFLLILSSEMKCRSGRYAVACYATC